MNNIDLKLDKNSTIVDEIVQLARLSLSGRAQDIQLYLRRLARRYHESLPSLSKSLSDLLADSPTRTSMLRREPITPVPVDLDSRMELIRRDSVTALDIEPVFRPEINAALNQLVQERSSEDKLLRAGLAPTKSALFTGPPGVGKTLAARWLASKLKVPLFTLDLAAVMSSYLGRTGNNVRHVLDYAKSANCILLLDEFDAVAKRRDDSTEIGELKRLVTVLLQEIDDWPASGLLIAATNHPDLLDPAAWRRFELKVEFFLPNRDEAKAALCQLVPNTSETVLEMLSVVFESHSFSEIERSILLARRAAAMANQPVELRLNDIITDLANALPKAKRQELALKLVESNTLSRRQVHELTGVSRDTIRKRERNTNDKE